MFGRLRRGIVEHDGFVDESNVELLQELGFVFLTVGNGHPRQLLLSRLEAYGVPFIDVGLGVTSPKATALRKLHRRPMVTARARWPTALHLSR